MARVEISLGNWNNQAEYDAYKTLSPMDQAADDFELPATKVLVGYRKIVIYTPWGEDFIPLEFDIQGVPRNDLKYTVFFRTKAQESRYQSAYQIIEEADLISEYEYWKSKVTEE